MLTLEMKNVIRNELLTDPAGRGYVGKTPQEQADLINAGYTTQPPTPAAVAVDVSTSAVQKIIVPTMELFRITRESEKPTTGGAEDAVIAAAWSFSEMLTRWENIETSNPDTWKAAQAAMGALQQAGLLSQSSVDRITALVNPTPVAPPPREEHARIFEIFIRNPVSIPDDFLSYEITADEVAECIA